MRFSCVSKTWLSIIKDPNFVESHHTRSYTRPSGIKLIACKKLPGNRFNTSAYNVYYIDPEGNSPLKFLTLPAVLTGSDLTRLHSVHGLICASNCIWNPTTNESILLPSVFLNTFIDGDCFEITYIPEYYLAFDSSKNAHKVLCILNILYANVETCRSALTCRTCRSTRVFKILDLGGSSWRDVESVPSQLLDCCCSFKDSCSIDNFICFRVSKFPESLLWAFDVRYEKFEVLPVPHGLTHPYRFIQVGEYISLLHKRYDEIGKQYETMWMLEDYKKHQWRSDSLEFGPLLKRIKSKVKSSKYMEITPLGAIHNGEILLLISSGKMLYYFCYDIDRRIGRSVPKLLCRMNGTLPDLSVNTSFKIHVESMYRLK